MGDKQHVGRLVGVLVVFLCLHVFTAHGGWWVWVRFWVGYKAFLCCCLVVGGFQAHCRVHVQHRLSVLARMLPPLFFVALFLWGVWGVVVCVVGCL